MKPTNTLGRRLGAVSALLGVLVLVRIQSPGQAVLLWLPKLLGSAFSPFLALAGALGALLGLAHRDAGAVLAGAAGVALAARYVARVSAPHAGFALAFGPDWQARIPPDLQARMAPRRFRFPAPAPPDVPWERDVAIGTHHETGDPLLADVWRPPAGVPPTGVVVIYLHGSGWHLQDKDQGTRPFFRRLAGQGHLVVDVAYTLAPRARLHAMLADVKRAIAWAKAHAAAYGGDPGRIVLVGGSAGGHLGLLAAYTPNHPELDPEDVDADTSVRAVVSFYGVVDLDAVHRDLVARFDAVMTGRTPLERGIIARLEPLLRRARAVPPYGSFVSAAQIVPGLLGCAPDEAPEICRLGSPIQHVGSHCPPTLLLQGAHDLGILPARVRQLHQALLEAGVPSVYVEYPETDHGFDLIVPRWSPAAQAATYELERFLALVGSVRP